jgi:pimeloyl-ACP methyl ester carboxylesterase
MDWRPLVIFFAWHDGRAAKLAPPNPNQEHRLKSIQQFCASLSFQTGKWTAIAVAIAAATASAAHDANAAETAFQGMKVEVVGTGRPLVMIPGLNSSADTWRETCQALQPQVQCHILQLPGFAGQAPVKEEKWLEAMRDRVLAYADHAGLEHPDLIGHSLGGFIGLEISIKAPERFAHVVIVDSLPFLGGARNPAMTVEAVRPMAEGMRAGMLAADEASYKAQLEAGVAALTTHAERVPELARWGSGSDRQTTTQAMYELMTTDLRPALEGARTPTLVLGSWASYARYGATKASTQANFEQQYAAHPDVRIALSDSGYHFLMWDDPQWLQSQVREFLAKP